MPSRVVTNAELTTLMDTTEEWIVQRTGIRERRFVEPGTGASDLGVTAARVAIERAGLTPKDIQFLIFATLSPDLFFPGAGVFVQEKLGLDTVGALDVRTQCTGFLYALSVLDMSTAGRDVSVIFGDGGGAVVVGPSETGVGILSSHLHSEGKYARELMTEAPASSENPRISKEMLDARRHFGVMNGRSVFAHAVRRFPEVILEALSANGMEVSDLSLVIPHQANLRITQAVAKSLGIPPEKVFSNIEKYGNTTAASVPIALDECATEGRIRAGDLVCLAAFGSGFTWASSLIR